MIVFTRVLAGLALVAITIALAGADSAFAGPSPLGAPGPIAGAGLPILAVGFGAYWLVKRFRRKTD
jgi:hypothetical protein